MSYDFDAAIAARFYRELFLAEAAERELTEPPDPVVFGPFE